MNLKIDAGKFIKGQGATSVQLQTYHTCWSVVLKPHGLARSQMGQLLDVKRGPNTMRPSEYGS